MMRLQDDRSRQSGFGLCDQDSGIRQSRRKILLSNCSLQKMFNSYPVRNTSEAPPGWRGIQKTCQGGGSCLFIRGVQYVHWVMHKCIMVKVGGEKKYI